MKCDKCNSSGPFLAIEQPILIINGEIKRVCSSCYADYIQGKRWLLKDYYDEFFEKPIDSRN